MSSPAIYGIRCDVAAAAVLAFGLLPCAMAQPRLVGLTRTTPLVVGQSTASCLQSQCTPAGVPAPSAAFPWVGGTAYDASTRGTWVSNGLVLAKVDERNACTPECAVQPMPDTSPNNPVTGLAYYEPASTLYVTDQSNAIRSYTVSGGCILSLAGRCQAAIPAGDVLTGCAIDDQTGQIFYSVVTPGSPGGKVYVAQIGLPCTPFCSFAVLTCGTNTLGPLLGLGYDACSDRLWVTDGRFSVGLSFDPIACTVLGEVQCCANLLEPFVGLDVLPGSEVSAGSSCSAGSCPPCATMQHVLGGDPYVSSPTFSLDLINAPGASTAVGFINIGPCVPPFFSPPLCAGLRVLLSPPPLSSPFATGGTAGLCNGAASFPIPIPADWSLCGASLCSQFIGICPGGGHFVSNALDWTVVGS